MDKKELCLEFYHYFKVLRDECVDYEQFDHQYFIPRKNAFNKVLEKVSYYSNTRCVNISVMKADIRNSLRYYKNIFHYNMRRDTLEYFLCIISAYKYMLNEVENNA